MVDVRRLPVGEANEAAVTLDDLAREGARRMIAAALEAEVGQYVSAFAGEVDEDGKRLVVRNGRARERKLTVGSGTVPIRAPRVNDKRVDESRRSASGSARGSCRRTRAARRRSPRCCPCSTCTACRPATSGRRCAICSARMRRGCRRARSPADRAVAGRSRRVQGAAAGLSSLRVPVHRRRPRLGAARRRRPAVPAGRHRGPRGRRQGTLGRRGRLPRDRRTPGPPCFATCVSAASTSPSW